MKAPRTCPKSSDSTSVGGMAAQFTATNGFFARDEPACSERAASSLPVPDSPVMSTVQRVSATCERRASTGTITGSSPRSQGATRSRHPRGSSPCAGVAGGLSTAATASSSVCTSNGLMRKSRAPACMAFTASGISALPLIAMTGVPGATLRAAFRISNPLTPGMRMSVRIMSKRSCCSLAKPAGPSAVTTSCPAVRRIRPRLRRSESSSSQRRILPMTRYCFRVPTEGLDDMSAAQVSHEMVEADYFFAIQPTITGVSDDLMHCTVTAANVRAGRSPPGARAPLIVRL